MIAGRVDEMGRATQSPVHAAPDPKGTEHSPLEVVVKTDDGGHFELRHLPAGPG